MNRTSIVSAGFAVASCLASTSNFANTLNSSSASATMSITSHWGAGYCVNIDIKAGGTSVSDWSLQIDTNGTQINNVWNGHLSGNEIVPMGWNKSISPNNSVNIGFCGNGSGAPTLQSFTAMTSGVAQSSSSLAVPHSSSSIPSTLPSSSSRSSSASQRGSSRSSSSISSHSSTAGDGQFTLVFRDDFNHFDSSRWQRMTHSWAGNLALFSSDTVSVSDGMMTLKLKPAPANTVSDGEGKRFLGAEVRSVDTIEYGRVSARIKFAKGSAVVSSLVTIYTPWPADNWNEFDIEILGKNPREAQYNAMVYTGPRLTPPVTNAVTPTQYPSLQQLGFDSSNEFRVYTIEWTPREATFLIDGVVQHRWVNRMDLIGLPQNILLTIWASNAASWAGPVTQETVNAEAIYDWVEVWRYQP